MAPVKVLGISGSLRKGSYNTALLRAAQELAPHDMALEIANIAAIPPFDADLQAQGFPEAVSELAEKVRAADGILMATPEYNYSVPGVLKNALDWVSRVPEQPFDGKTVAIMGASPGRLGTARAQYHLRQVFVFLNARVLNRPEVFVAAAHERIGNDGRLADEATRGIVANLLEALQAAIAR